MKHYGSETVICTDKCVFANSCDFVPDLGIDLTINFLDSRGDTKELKAAWTSLLVDNVLQGKKVCQLAIEESNSVD